MFRQIMLQMKTKFNTQVRFVLKKAYAFLSTCTFRYTLFGAIYGFCLSLLATIVDLYLRGQPAPLPYRYILALQLEPIHGVINIAAVVLTIFGYLVGRNGDRFKDLTNHLEEELAKNTSELVARNAELQSEIAERQRIEGIKKKK